MILSDLSVKRPVFATVISMLLVLLGTAAALNLPVRQYPDIDPPVVSIETSYRGAAADVVETKVTQLIEDRIAGLEGIIRLTSSSSDERSDIRVEFSLDRSVDEAANDIRDRVSRVLDQLPDEADPPEIAKVDNDTRPVMYLNLTSGALSGLELTDYADRFLIDRFSTVPGVARVRLSGARTYAMRIWLDRESLAARGLTVTDVENALRSENVQLPAGRLESSQREFTLRTSTGYETETDFQALVIGRGADGQLVRLGEVATVRLGAENERSIARANTIPAVSLGIEQLSTANSVEVSKQVRREVAAVAEDLPEGMQLDVNYDRAEYIEASMNEVYKALGFALLLVLVVIYLFLGTFRATLVPAVVVPVSIIATFMVMQTMGYSINILTLLGLVLAIGLVVDDAIVVLENIYRRIEADERPLLAALDGAQEIGFAVIATTAVLVAVFVPLSFITGDVGRLFNEFGITLAAAVIFSSVVALTLTPMMCSKLFSGRRDTRSALSRRVDQGFRWLSARYRGLLEQVLRRSWITVGAGAMVTLLALAIYASLPAEYAPKEDRGAFFILMQAPEGASLEYTDRYAREMEEVLMREVDDGPVMRFLTRLPGAWGGSGEVNSARAILLMDPWDDRDEGVEATAARVRQNLADLPGVNVRVSTPQSLGIRGGDRPINLVLGGPDYEQLREWRDVMLEEMRALPELVNPSSNYRERKPQLRVGVDRDRAAALGVSLSTVGRTLETMLGSRVVTTYIDRGREYNVILQGEDSDRSSPDDLTNLYVRSGTTGRLVPLENLVSITEEAGPDTLSRFDRMRSITIEAGLAPGVPIGAAIDALAAISEDRLPASARVSWDGEAAEYLESGSSLTFTFTMALLIVFLVLAAQFESFRHPLIILVTVPLAMAGAVAGLWLYGATVNVFTQIGAILLIGLAAKNGVLIVEFANQLRDRGMAFEEAIIEGATIRLRPILMTSACTSFGALPLLLGTGPGAESRQPIGIVIVFGVAISAVLTLFVVPALYAVLARNTKSPEYVARLVTRLKQREAGPTTAQPKARDV